MKALKQLCKDLTTFYNCKNMRISLIDLTDSEEIIRLSDLKEKLFRLAVVSALNYNYLSCNASLFEKVAENKGLFLRLLTQAFEIKLETKI